MRMAWAVSLALFLALVGCLTKPSLAQTASPGTEASLPDAPQSQFRTRPSVPAANACQVKRAGGVLTGVAAIRAAAASGVGIAAGGDSEISLQPISCPALLPVINWYARFTNGPQVKPLTPTEKGWLAVRNLMDPFNLLTLVGSSAIAVGADSHSPYGPGMPGFGRYVGVSFTEDMTGEFVDTFMIPSIMHQDPHYHRMPNASVKRRIAHALYQVVWTQGDNGKGMLNYANLVGYAIDDEVANLYVPGRETDFPASAERYGTGLATAPIDNFVSEFLPDVARRIHVQIFVVQQIINQVAKTEPAGSQ